MEKGKKIFAAFKHQIQLHETSNGWYRFKNPFDLKSEIKNDLTMAYNPSINWVKCFRTGYSKNAVNFLMDYWQLDYKNTLNTIDKYKEFDFKIVNQKIVTNLETINYPYSVRKLIYDDGILANRARKYLEGRNFNINYLDYLGFGFFASGDNIGYIFIPYFVKNKLCYWTARSFIGGDRKYINPKRTEVSVGKSEIIYNQDALDIYDLVFVVEGIFDAITIGQNAVALSGWSISKAQLNIINKSKVKELIFIPDKDFCSTTKKQAAKLIFSKKIKILPTYLIENWEDVNKNGFDAVIPLIETTNYLTYKDIL